MNHRSVRKDSVALSDLVSFHILESAKDLAFSQKREELCNSCIPISSKGNHAVRIILRVPNIKLVDDDPRMMLALLLKYRINCTEITMSSVVLCNIGK